MLRLKYKLFILIKSWDQIQDLDESIFNDMTSSYLRTNKYDDYDFISIIFHFKRATVLSKVCTLLSIFILRQNA